MAKKLKTKTVSVKQQLQNLQTQLDIALGASVNWKTNAEFWKRKHDESVTAFAQLREDAVTDACTKVAEAISGKSVKTFNIVFY